MHEFLVDCADPVVFDLRVQSLGGALVKNEQGDFEQLGTHYVMRVYRNARFLCYAIEHQEMGRVIEPLVRE